MAKKWTYPSTLVEREEFSSQLADLIKRFGADQINIPQSRPLLQAILTDQLANIQFVDPFFGYANLLLPLDKQFELLVEYNEKYWNGAITKDIFATVDTASDHIQRVEDLEILYMQFGSDKDTFENWVAVFKGEHPNFDRGGSLGESYDIRRLAKNTFKYPVGIHRIHINLAAHWDPKKSTSVDDTLAQVKGSTEKLAHGEIFAAYGLHTELFQKTDGVNLPYFDSAGYQVKPFGDSEWRFAPYGRWIADDRRAKVDSYWTDYGFQSCARPVVWES